MDSTRLALLGVPSSAGGRRTGQELGPGALRAAGLAERLEESGRDVLDLGDLPVVRFRPDPEHPTARNVPLVLDVARGVAAHVDRATVAGCAPLVVGGDCTIGLGVVAGLLGHRARLGLLYLDAHLDLNTPETSPSGILDGMVLAHLLGRGVPELVALGPRRPMLSESDVVVFGHDPDSGAVDPYEIETLERSRMATYPLREVRRDPSASARAALRAFDDGVDGFAVHFDVDVTNLPCADVAQSGGLDVDDVVQALKVFVRSPRCSAVVVTEFNGELDPDGAGARRIVEGLVGALAP